jgi:hypothetical protein
MVLPFLMNFNPQAVSVGDAAAGWITMQPVLKLMFSSSRRMVRGFIQERNVNTRLIKYER